MRSQFEKFGYVQESIVNAAMAEARAGLQGARANEAVPPTAIDEPGVRDASSGEVRGDWYRIGERIGSARIRPY